MRFGVHYIEGGWPGSNPKDLEFFKQAAKRKWRSAKIAAFSMTRRKGVAVESDDLMRQILEAETPVVTIVGKTWLLHVKEVLRVTPEGNLAMIGDTVKFLKDHGKTVFYDAEHSFDGFKDEPDYALATWQAAEKAGADGVILCDTNGGCLPEEIARITAHAKGKLNCAIGIHTHDDAGVGVANALAGIAAGATQVQGTINGYGERTGNCNLISVIPLLHFKLKKVCVPEKSLPKLKELSEFVDEIANLRHNPRQPWVGATAFAHKGGMHVHAIDRVVAQLRAHPAGSCRQFSPRSRERHVRPHEHFDEGVGTRFQIQAGFAGVENHHRARQGTGKRRLRIRGRRRLHVAAHPRSARKNSRRISSVETYHVSMRRDQRESICEAT